MTSTQAAISLEYLTQAAHLLRSASPKISAHLLRNRAALFSSQDASQAQPLVQRQHVCASCGHIMLPGRDGTDLKVKSRILSARLPSGKRKSIAHGTKPVLQGPVKVLSCGQCHSLTKTNLSAPERVARRRKAPRPLGLKTAAAGVVSTSASASAPAPLSVSDEAKPTANASSKKRAKNRKAGLQALLSGQQQKSSNSFTLADFGRK